MWRWALWCLPPWLGSPADCSLETIFRIDLRGANLSDAKLQGVDFRGADLRGAFVVGADLQNADLRGADLRGLPAGELMTSLAATAASKGRGFAIIVNSFLRNPTHLSTI